MESNCAKRFVMQIEEESSSSSTLPVSLLRGMIVGLVNFITKFEKKYLWKKEDAKRFHVERLKEDLLKLQPGLDIAHRVMLIQKDKTREWYWNVKDMVYEVEDLFEDIELEVMAESDQMSKMEELLKDTHLDLEAESKLVEELLEDTPLEVFFEYNSRKIRSYSPPSPTPTPTTLWSLLLQRQRGADSFLLLQSDSQAPFFSTETRMSLIMVRLDNLLAEMPLFGDSPPPSPSSSMFMFPCSHSRVISHGSNGGNGKAGLGLATLVDDEKHKKDPGYKHLPWYLRRCLEFCYIFPTDISFKKQDLVLLWVAEGLVHPLPGFSLEDEAAYYFDTLLSWSYFCKSLYHDPPSYQLRFNWKAIDPFVMNHEHIQHYDFHGFVSEKTRHASVTCPSISEGHLAHSRALRTILLRKDRPTLYSNSNSGLNKVPAFLFLKVRYLHALDLSHAGFEEMPCRVWDLIHLRYLDLSYNPIKSLSVKIINLFRLQTLKLVRSLRLTSFPQDFYMLSNLRHILISPINLNLMPTHVGRLTSLQTLLEFNVLRKDGCRIGELRDLNDLRGQLSIKNLENVASLEEAKEARLHLKQGIHELHLLWSESDNDLNVNYDIIQGLRPHHNLKALQIFNYSNSRFPSWVSDPLYTNLISITLTRCISQELPPFGGLPRLESLTICEVHGVKHIGPEFYGHGMVKIGFPSLLTLSIRHMNDLETWAGFTCSDLPMLQELVVADCEKLKHLPEIKSLNSLVKMEIFDCLKLQCLPKKGLPIMVQHLRVSRNPELEERCQRGSGLDWYKIAHIPEVRTDLSEMY